MKAKNYLILCVVVAAATALTVLYVPGVASSIETLLLAFLATNAR